MTTIEVSICVSFEQTQLIAGENVLPMTELHCSSSLHREKGHPTNKGRRNGWLISKPPRTLQRIWVMLCMNEHNITNNCHLPLVFSLDVIRPQGFILLPKYYTTLNAVIVLLFIAPKWLSLCKLWQWKFTQFINAHMGPIKESCVMLWNTLAIL